MLLPLHTDSYKLSHWKMYHPKTERVYSYLEARDGALFDEIVFFGLQMILKKHFEGPVLSQAMIDGAVKIAAAHFGSDTVFNRDGWQRLLQKHGGRLPLRIRAVPEGTIVGKRQVMMTIDNTDEEFPWLTNWAETLLMQVWYPTTVATLSREIKKRIRAEMLETSGSDAGLEFKLHDFGYRGSTSRESAGIGGCAHLVNFLGTDTLEGLDYAMAFYNSDVCASSIPATEHSIMTQEGPDGEARVAARVLATNPTGLVAQVGDSFDIEHFVDETLGIDLYSTIMGREGTLVVRPDSGDPAESCVKVAQLLWKRFGGDVNAVGYKVLNEKVRIIQGDGIKWNFFGKNVVSHTVEGILRALRNAGFAAENIAFGSGGGLLQDMNRDTLDMAIKCSATKIDGEWRDVFKKAPGKSSLSGRFNHPGLKTVFYNGTLLVDDTFEAVRDRAVLS